MRAECKGWALTVALSVCLATPTLASGDFPHASCKTWNGTVVAISGVGTKNARMTGIITQADVQEYCDRSPADETLPNGTKLAIPQCVARYFHKLRHVKLLALADCARGTIEFRDGARVVDLQFPTEEKSCASCHAPLIAQFTKLCPTRAKELKVNEPMSFDKLP